LAPSDFWLSPKIRFALKGQRFQDIEGTQKSMIKAVKAVPQQGFQKCFQQRQEASLG
jgi:hypothetical protein